MKKEELREAIKAQLLAKYRIDEQVEELLAKATAEETPEEKAKRLIAESLGGTKKRGGGSSGTRACSVCGLSGTRLTPDAKSALGEKHTQEQHIQFREASKAAKDIAAKDKAKKGKAA